MTAAVGSVPGSLIDWAAGVIGMPAAVVAAQINEESGGNPAAVSPTGAQGVAQFEPGTWAGEGCAGSPNDVNSAMTCYAKYMYQLLQQEHGSVRNALAAYNAGPGNLSAGYGYADTILSNAGQPSSLAGAAGTGSTAGAPTTAGSADLCAWNLSAGPLSGCVLSKVAVRELAAAGLLVVSAVAGLAAVAVLAAFAFRASGAAAAIGAAVPPVRVLARAAGAAGAAVA